MATRSRIVASVGAVLLLVTAVVLLRGGPSSPVAGLEVLGGEPRLADAAGVVSRVTRSQLVLDDRTLDLASEAITFSSYNLAELDLAGRVGQYVHVGLDESGRVAWVAAIGKVVDGIVLFTSDLLLVNEGLAYFADGTVLHVSRDVDRVVLPAYIHARIDIATDLVTSLTTQ